MTTYIIQRLLLAMAAVIGVSILTFVLIRVVPGDIAVVKCGQPCTAEDLAEVRHLYGLDRHLTVQFFDWVGDLFKGDLGESFYWGEPVVDILRRTFPLTFELALLSTLFAIIIGIPAGSVSAMRQDSWLDYVIRVPSIVGLAVPGFVLGVLAIMLPAMWWHISIVRTYVPIWENPLENLRVLVIPASLLGVASSCAILRLTRSSMLEVLRQDYVRTAWAKGLRERVVVVRHAVRNALIPVVTVLGLQFGVLLGGTVVFESLFRLQGMGLTLINSLINRDYPVLQGNVFVIATLFVMVNLAVDLLYGVLDPRIRYR